MPTDPPIPVVEQIAVAFAEAIGDITEANDYQITLTPHRPARVDDVIKKDMAANIEQGDPEKDEELTVEGNPPAIAWIQPFIVSVYVKTSDSSTTPIETRLNLVGAEVMRGIAAGLAEGTDLYDLILNWNFEPLEWMRDESVSSEIVSITVNITYRVAENDPYTPR